MYQNPTEDTNKNPKNTPVPYNINKFHYVNKKKFILFIYIKYIHFLGDTFVLHVLLNIEIFFIINSFFNSFFF